MGKTGQGDSHWINEAQELQIEIAELYREFDQVLLSIINEPNRSLSIATAKRDEIIEHELVWRRETAERAIRGILKRRFGITTDKTSKPE